MLLFDAQGDPLVETTQSESSGYQQPGDALLARDLPLRVRLLPALLLDSLNDGGYRFCPSSTIRPRSQASATAASVRGLMTFRACSTPANDPASSVLA